ncbi:hypothetical protein [[Clostridium] hylemonae]|uniref:hypothetical protein n=1 Tax=[Clostridium] hylemonae TaxID=89153 RepID=UPI001FA9F27C|nr:hypothetical protein [[Clostridium] hylemonae]
MYHLKEDPDTTLYVNTGIGTTHISARFEWYRKWQYFMSVYDRHSLQLKPCSGEGE